MAATTRVLCCPDSLKEVLPAPDAAAALAAGVRQAGGRPAELPLADGGEGTAEVLARAFGGEWRSATVSDALGRPTTAAFLLLADGRAVVEVAQAIGLDLLAPEERDPLAASSRGAGELLLAAVAAGATASLVCLGGSATVDGGAGLREVVTELPVPTTVLADVANPLLGDRGAARVYGPQKGAGPDAVQELERRLGALDVLRPFAHLPGAGAAGGLGAAFAALGASVVPGSSFVAEAVDLVDEARASRLVITGEGGIDRSSFEGKVVSAVAHACERAGRACVAFGGTVAEDVLPLARDRGVAVFALSGDRSHAAADLEQLAYGVTRVAIATGPHRGQPGA
jgi:glycerate 2-kinase